MKSFVSPSFLKQKARQLKKEKSLTQHQALDEASKLYGFSNYKNYLNSLEAGRKQARPSKEDILKRIYSENDESRKANLATTFIQYPEAPFQDVFDILSSFQGSDALQTVCEKSNLKSEIQAFLLNDFRTDEGKSEIGMYAEYFVAKEVSVKNLVYKVNGDTIEIVGEYDLKIEFEFELDKEDPISQDDRFKDRDLFGSFELTIDRSKKITIEHSDLGENYDGGFQFASFR